MRACLRVISKDILENGVEFFHVILSVEVRLRHFVDLRKARKSCADNEGPSRSFWRNCLLTEIKHPISSECRSMSGRKCWSIKCDFSSHWKFEIFQLDTKIDENAANCLNCQRSFSNQSAFAILFWKIFRDCLRNKIQIGRWRLVDKLRDQTDARTWSPSRCHWIWNAENAF